MKFLNFEEAKRENKELIAKNKSLKEEKIYYWWENEKLQAKVAELKKEIERLKQQTTVNVSIGGEDLAKAVMGVLNEEKEHKCTPKCFGKHVIKSIQKDYDSCSKKAKSYFLMYWYDNLSAFYPWLEKLYIIDGKIYFKSKENSI